VIVKSVLMGLALEAVSLDDLQKPGWFPVYYESVVFHVWGSLQINTTGTGRHRVRWDTRHPGSWGNYLKAREDLARQPVPYGVT
jgi:hypothetical protein